jgi:short-subunit dehydrogenase involved in D-alanine esterification of teichoic acids
LIGKTVLVTGSTDGVGRLVARRLAEIRSPIGVITGLDPVISRSRGLMAGSSPAMTKGE